MIETMRPAPPRARGSQLQAPRTAASNHVKPTSTNKNLIPGPSVWRVAFRASLRANRQPQTGPYRADVQPGLRGNEAPRLRPKAEEEIGMTRRWHECGAGVVRRSAVWTRSEKRETVYGKLQFVPRDARNLQRIQLKRAQAAPRRAAPRSSSARADLLSCDKVTNIKSITQPRA
ncbi:unnamed protein product [Spodoptera exigua]|nr:unnamed protein product [Spodoptera exigua]